ncbi:glycosyltransferase, partial [Acinetobacter seifertii]|nr:glycosyltransferase [Acinetobacter seifertii]
MNQINEIKVSICVVTYNQEKYLAECLEKLVHQQTNFSFEIIIGEDCSTDNTRAIVQEYYEKYPDLIIPILYKENVGAIENILQVYA